MRTLWNLLEDEPGFPSLENSGFTLISAEENGCDVIICGLEHVEYAGALVNPQDTFFIVALNDPEHERHLVPNTLVLGSIVSVWNACLKCLMRTKAILINVTERVY